jgi:hypothetical protein
MSASSKPTRSTCSDPTVACGCCAGTEAITPQSTANRPGLSALSYRVGTHATFLETMKARLSSHALGDPQVGAQGEGKRPLAGLTTRDNGDPSIALLDAWATVGDVLTFYQELIANEGYLRTATERRSVLELARLVGYSPRPGVAASTYLAYTIDANTQEEVLIPAGARVQSVPGPDELPQSFEASEDLKARAAWNRLVARKTAPQQWSTIQQSGKLYIKGSSTNLKANDPLLIDRGPGDPQLFRVTAVNADAAADRTELGVAPWEGATATAIGFESVRAVAKQLIESAPEGKAASRLVENLHVMSNVASCATDSREVGRFIDKETMPLLETLVENTHGPAPNLRKWMADAQQALTKSREQAGRSIVEASEAAANNTEVPFSERLNALIRKPSRPLTNSLQLPRALASSFRPTSDAGLKALGLASPDLRASLGAAIETYARASPEPRLEVYALRLKAGVFGRNAPKRTRTISTGEETQTEVIGEWPIVGYVGNTLAVKTESLDAVFLDGNYEGILPGSWLVLDASAVPVFPPNDFFVDPAVFATGDKVLVARAQSVATKVARAEYGMTGDSVRIGLDRAWLRFTPQPVVEITEALAAANSFDDPLQPIYDNDYQIIRGSAIYAQSELLELADAPIESAVCDGASEEAPLELDGLYRDLEPGRFVIVSGERSDIAETTGVLATEAVMITEVVHDVRAADAAVPQGDSKRSIALPGDRTHTFIRLDKPLSYCYRRDSLVIHGNVVKATHGETRVETLGGGDGSRALQSFTLKQSPLTYLAAPTAFGAASSLQVFVNDVRWHEEPSFVDLEATDHAFITRTDDSSKTTLTFGNGREGARLPTGTENIKAVYRNGIGKHGNVRAGQLSLLSTRPLGVKEVINPLRASGGADRETRDQARRSAPLAVMSLDRLVSTPDYADFARSFAGIGKADAVELSDGRRTVVHVTIAGTDDIPIDIGSDLFRNLRRALIDLGDPFQPVRIATRELLLLVISAGLRIDPDYRWESVVAEVRSRLLETFGFERRELAEDVSSSEVLSTIQSVRGIVYVDLDAFGALPSTTADAGAEEGRRPLTPDETAEAITDIVQQEPAPRVVAEPARVDPAGILPAQLAVLVPEVDATLILNQIKD